MNFFNQNLNHYLVNFFKAYLNFFNYVIKYNLEYFNQLFIISIVFIIKDQFILMFTFHYLNLKFQFKLYLI